MAVLTGTINNVFNVNLPFGPKVDANGYEIRCAFITFSITGTYAQGDDAQLLTVGTRIKTLTRDGKTVQALLDVAMAAPGDENAARIGVKTLAISTQTITFELTGSDLSTEHANGALAALNHDICLFLTYTVS